MDLVALLLYRGLIVPISLIVLPLASVFNKKIALGLRLRRQRAEPLPADSPAPIWIHAASGEFEYAKAVIRELKHLAPEVPIVVTFFSPTFAKACAQFPGVARALPLPLDLPGPCRSFLKKYKPRALLISRTDIWPEMLEQCASRKVPVTIFSYTQKRFNSYLKRVLTRWLLRKVERIYCVSEPDRLNLAPLKLKSEARVMGDTRYDQVHYRLNHGQVLPVELKPKLGPLCFLAGSTWPEDERVILEGLKNSLRSGQIKLILVPHEPTTEHLRALKVKLEQLDLTSALFSEKRGWDDRHVLLIDQVGVLAELYEWADLAFVGGSFKKSVHSVMEALGAGCLTYVGPFHENNREAVEFKSLMIRGRPGLTVISDAQALIESLEEIFAEPARLREFAEGLRNEFQTRLGASQRLCAALEDQLKI